VFDVSDTALRQLVIHGQRIGGPDAPAAEWQPILEASKAALPGDGSVSVTGADGLVRHSTLRAIVGQPRGEHYVFKELAKATSDVLVVDAPFESPVYKGRYVLPIGRRLSKPDGRFDGIVVAVVSLEAFRNFFKVLNLGSEGALSLFHPTGLLLFQQPSERNALGDEGKRHPLFLASQQGASGVVRGPLTPGGPRYISAYRRLGTLPLIVAPSLSEREALAPWRAERRTSIIEFGTLAATLGIFVLVLLRQIDARAKVERELAESQRAEAERLRAANEQLAASLEREREARRETEQANRLKDEFLMTLSHELRTPLNAILGWIRMLTTDAVPRERQQQALDVIERNAKSQTRLVEDLLDVSRAITGKLQIEARVVNIADAVLAAVETVRPAISARRIVFESSVDQSLDPILADPDRVQQIVWNLLSNAIKFTPEGGWVRLRVNRDGTTVRIIVSDSGIGIAPSFLPFVFDRFRQADAGPRRERGGLGLGLAIVRHLVELHGGTVAAESAGEDQGATFTVTLPTRPA
jgi:signal transduction histidine kinase